MTMLNSVGDQNETLSSRHAVVLKAGPVLVKAGPVSLWILDPYEGARVEWALYGSEIGCRLGDV
jgi:hypothetical protein